MSGLREEFSRESIDVIVAPTQNAELQRDDEVQSTNTPVTRNLIMKKSLPLTMVLLMVASALACKTYTKSLETSVTRAKETVALGAMRTIVIAEQTYAASNEGNFATFDQLVNAGYLNSQFNHEKPKLGGYILTLTVAGRNEAPSYSINADPEPPLEGRHFFVDSSANLTRVNLTQPAGPADPILTE